MAIIHRSSAARAQRWTMTVVILAGLALLTACGSSSTSGTAGTSASAPAAARASAAASSAAIRCGQLTALRVSLTQLGHAAVSLESAGQLAADLANVEHQLGKVEEQTDVAFAAQENQLTAAVDKIGKDAQAMVDHPSDANLNSLAAAVNNLKATAKPVIKKIDATCPAT
jgi:hypothetical protein